jgi:outer membrane translocation and assembly module TamA
VLSSGISAHFSYDTRDFIPNPYRGESLLANATVYRRALGSDTDMENLEITANKYFRMRERDVLAFDLYGNFNFGDVPWDMMATLGNNKRMRGYSWPISGQGHGRRSGGITDGTSLGGRAWCSGSVQGPWLPIRARSLPRALAAECWCRIPFRIQAARERSL